MQERTEAPEAQGGLMRLAILALIAGVGAGLVCALFRLSLDRAAVWRDDFAAFAANPGLPVDVPGWMLMALGGALAAAIAAGLVRRVAPEASGSGIPHAEAVLKGELEPARARLIPIKFAGGLLAIGGGLALGREGPSVQMGAGVANMVARYARCTWEDCRALIAGGAGAGLATAFNAPGAGAIFVIEELIGKFEPRTGLVALGATVGAISVSRAILGNEHDFHIPDMAAGGLGAQPLFLLLGLFTGVLAVLYCKCLLGALRLVPRLGGPVEMRAALIGGAVGALVWFVPGMVGGGDDITQKALNGGFVLAVLPGIFLFRLVLSSVSYAAATPGGLFAPILALGATGGLAFGYIAEIYVPELGVEPAAFAVVGMGALFTGIVRAPLTGIILVTEMTGSTTLLLPLLSSCFGAMLVAEAMKQPPIYESLGWRAAQKER